MSDNNDNWLNAFTARNEPKNADEKQARVLGDKLRAEYGNVKVDEQQVNAMLARLREQNLLKESGKYSTSHKKAWTFSLAAAMVMLAIIPVLMMQRSPSIDDYPVLRGEVVSKSIRVDEVMETANNLQKSLKAFGYSPKIYQYRGHLLVSFEVKEVTPELVAILGKYGLVVNQSGKQRIEILSSKN